MRRVLPRLATAALLIGASGIAAADDPVGKTNALKKTGRFAEAVKVYTADVKDEANLNALAWLQATCPDATYRDGKSAIAHAMKVCEATDWKNPNDLDTLAAAHAERGNFDQATLWEGLAVELASDAAKKEFATRLDLYNHRQAFREDPKTLPAGQDVPPPVVYTTIDECTAAIARHPDDVHAYCRRGQLQFERKAYDEAIADYTRAIAIEPTRAAHLRGRAIIRREQGHLDESLADYSAALKIAPSNQLFLSERAAIYQSKGDTVRAKADETALRVSRAMKHVAARQFSDAIKDYEEAINLSPTSPRARNQLAWLHATCAVADYRDGKAAVDQATRACDLTSYKNYQYLDTLAAAFAEAGDFEKALTWGSLAAELAPAARKAMIDEHLERFKKHQACRDDARS